MIHVQPWVVRTCALYAVVRDGRCLPDAFFDELARDQRHHAERLARFVDMITKRPYIRPALLRPERPDLGVFAMFNHTEAAYPYNPSRLLCAFVGQSNRIMVVGAGFIKTQAEPIQMNVVAHREAMQLARIATELSERIVCGAIDEIGPLLVPRIPDALDF